MEDDHDPEDYKFVLLTAKVLCITITIVVTVILTHYGVTNGR